MKIYFQYYDKDSNWIGRLYGWILKLLKKGKYGHVEINVSRIEDDYVCFGSIWKGIVKKYWKPSTKYGKWDIINMPIDIKTEYPITRWCYRQLHKPFDYTWFFSFLLPWHFDNPHTWGCSEFVARALAEGGIIEYKSRITPTELYNLLKEKGYD